MEKPHGRTLLRYNLLSFLGTMWILLCTGSHAGAQLPDVRINVDVSNKAVQVILDLISDQSGYYFTYDASLFPAKNRMSFDVKDLLLQTALDSLLRDSTFQYRLIDRNIVIYRRNSEAEIRSKQDTAFVAKLFGHVSDRQSGRSLPYATIGLYGTNKGTISNESGDFVLNIPTIISDPVLVVTFIGYRNQYCPVSLPSKGSIEISLDKNLVSLQEVIIRYQDPANLLAEAMRKIPENYLNVSSMMTAYYRENVQRNNKFLLFSEAVIEIRKDPYNGLHGDEKVRIIKGRKFVNVTAEDTVLMKIKSGIKSSLELDIVKNLPYFLTAENRKFYTFEFSDIVSYKNHLVYKISFRQKPQIKEALYTGDIYLDMQNLTILAADFQLNPTYIGLETNNFVIRKSPKLKIRPLAAVYHVEYRESEGKYHLSQVRGEVRFRMRKQKKWIGSLYSLNIEMAITDVETGKIQRFRNNESINTSQIFSDQTFIDDPAFWGDYNTIEPEASLIEVLHKMGKMEAW